jgi:AbiTii
VLGGQAGSEAMRDWARRELNGYTDVNTVPDYRRVPTALMALITNSAGYNGRSQRFSDSVFPPQIREIIREKVDMEVAIFNQGVGELESLASQGSEQHDIIPPWSGFIAETLNEHNVGPNTRVAEVYWSVPNASVRGILVRIRTALSELVAELITLTPQDQDVPDQAAADKAVQYVITGDRPTFHQYGGVSGNVAASSSDFTQNYYAGFDIANVRQFARLVAEYDGQLGLDAGQLTELAKANDELHEAIEAPADAKGLRRMGRAVDAVMRYVKLGVDSAIRTAAITAGNAAANDIDMAIKHIRL